MTAVATLYAMPELSFNFQVESNADWIDGIAYADASGNPIALDGIAVALTVRKSAGDPSVLFFASTGNGLLQLLPITVGGPNCSWAVVVPVASFPTFLPPGTYVFGIQGAVGPATRNLAQGSITVTQGVP